MTWFFRRSKKAYMRLEPDRCDQGKVRTNKELSTVMTETIKARRRNSKTIVIGQCTQVKFEVLCRKVAITKLEIF